MPSLTFADQGQGSDYKGASILQRLLPDNSIFLADGGYDDVWLRESLKAKGMTACILPHKARNEAFPFDKKLYNHRYLIENTFSKLKDWRRIATRYDRCDIPFSQLSVLLLPLSFILINESCLWWTGRCVYLLQTENRSQHILLSSF